MPQLKQAQDLAGDGLRTFPPRENGGNMDVHDPVAGSRVLLPVPLDVFGED